MSLRASLSSAFLMLIAAAPSSAAAADKVFTVANYPVEAEAANAVAAKEKALADGQEASFRSLLKRIVPVTAYKQLDRLKGLSAAEIVSGVKVRSEQNSTTRYIASLDFSFQAEAVRQTLAREGIPFVEEIAPAIVLVPVLYEAGSGEAPAGGSFRPASGTWAGVWKGLDVENTLTPLTIASLKPEIHRDTLIMAMDGTGSADRIFATEYQAERVVVAIAEVDRPGSRLNVTLAGSDAVGPIAWRRSYRISDGDVDYAMEFASVVSLGVLEGRWKVLKTGGSVSTAAFDSVVQGGGEDVALEVLYRTQQEWDDLRGRLLELPGVDDVRVNSISAGRAEVILKYPGGRSSLAGALSAQGLSLSTGAVGLVLRSGY